MERLRKRVELQAVPGYERGGTSTSQSLTRSGSLETDYINGEVVLQARLQGRAAPVNRALTDRIHAAQRDGIPARSLGDNDLLATVPQLTDPVDTTLTASPDEVLIDARSLHRQLLGPNPPAVLDIRWKLGDSGGRAPTPSATSPPPYTSISRPSSPDRLPRGGPSPATRARCAATRGKALGNPPGPARRRL